MSRLCKPSLALVVLLTALPAGAQRRAAVSPDGFLEIVSLTTDAVVLVDGVEVGIVPLERPIAVAAGEHVVRLVKPGYTEFVETVVVRRRQRVEVMADLLPYAGIIDVVANVPDARVHVGETLIGRTPLLGHELLAGEHVLRVEKDGHGDWTQATRIDAGRVYRFEAVLEARGAPVPEAALSVTPAPPSGPAAQPIWTEWWLWTAVGVLVVGTAAGVALGSGTDYVVDCSARTDVQGHIGLGTCGQ